MLAETPDRENDWPELPYSEWKDTCTTLHLWTQVVGKIRLAYTPWLNHSWHVTLYPTVRGLTTSVIPHGQRAFDIEFDLCDHQLVITTSDRDSERIALKPRTVASFYAAVVAALGKLGIAVRITELPCEITDAIAFSRDDTHGAYDPDHAHRFWRALVQVDRVFKQFRMGFIGKSSPVHFFWGSFDLAVTRFSGRRAPLHPGGVPGASDLVMQEAYSHELSSAGFWPGGGGIDFAAFYSYAYPQPPGFRDSSMEPAEAYFDSALGEFLLPYDAVRKAKDPDATLMAFLQSTYRAASTSGNWNRAMLECPIGQPGIPRLIETGGR
jgi:Family of unknown function (DUF5996)